MTEAELAQLKKQMVIKLGTTTNDESTIISNMVDNASSGGGGGGDNIVFLSTTVGQEDGYLYLGKSFNDLLAYYNDNKIVIAKWQFSNDGGGEVTAYQEYDIAILNKLTNDEQFGYGAYFGERGFFSNTADGELYAD